ncbi:hypothetical protein VHEMI10664 [[Torrubiella] hemipterigena]|uniref:Uncharacterized protein n=1 Tax=[Torrubiella] hemipterigena TaxID=1531966 RepID=A0A0A1TTM4_9HYPO|nr:hypothetical protein VHEMI10664 [[Torrubiella] hemipterigena]
MECFKDELSAVFQHSFEVRVSHTNRQDQWYKRRLQSWKTTTKNQGPLILSPTASKSEWAPKVLNCTSRFAKHIRSSAADELAQPRDQSLPTKLFPDTVFQGQSLMAEVREGHTSLPLTPLAPSMQRIDFWLADKNNGERARATKALLQLGMLSPLLKITAKRSSKMKEAAFIRHRLLRCEDWHDDGWLAIADDVAQVAVFIVAMAAYPEALAKNKAYVDWIPLGKFISNETPVERFMALHSHRADDGSGMNQLLDQCVTTMVHVTALGTASGLDAIDWETKLNEAVLLFIGFESWNRERHGQGYLGSNLNKPRHASWLTQGVDDGDDIVASSDDNVVRGPVKPRDPLHLRPEKAKPLDDESAGASDSDKDELSIMETKEADYGKKRSTKYQTRQNKRRMP